MRYKVSRLTMICLILVKHVCYYLLNGTGWGVQRKKNIVFKKCSAKVAFTVCDMKLAWKLRIISFLF